MKNGFRMLSCALVLAFFARPERVAADLAWHSEKALRWADLAIPAGSKTGFTLLSAAQTGIGFTNSLDEMSSAANRILLNGAGVATGDYDKDGLPDIYLCSLSGHSALYRNLGGLRFEDVTAKAGAGLSNRITRGAVFADINGDGWPDLLVSTLSNGVVCLLNNGSGQFMDATAAARTSSGYGSVTLALGDLDGDGTLDLYVTNYRNEDIRDRGQVDLLMVKGQLTVPAKLKDRLRVVAGQVLEYGQPDQVLLNNGRGQFSPLSWTNGAFLDEDGAKLASPPLDWGLTASIRDLNQDGFPDIYVCNDYWTVDRIWINDGHGTFHALPRLALRETSSSSMGVDFADIDRDGYLDFMVTDMLSRDRQLRRRQMPARWPIPEPKESIEFRPQIIQNTLFHNRGDGTFEEVSNYAGVAASEWSWQPLFLDADLDGWPDLLIPAGHARDVQDMDAERQIRARQHSWNSFTNAVEKQKAYTREIMLHLRLYPPLEMPIFAFRNTGKLRFEEVTDSWGTAQKGVHHSVALADFDQDGDLDLVVNNLRAPPGIYRNDATGARVAVRLKGAPPNTEGIGAQLELRGGALPLQKEEMISGGRYLSGSDPMIVFAAGRADNIMSLTVRWRNGLVRKLENIRPNRLYEVEETPAAEAPTAPGRTVAAAGSLPPAMFEDVSQVLAHSHRDAPYDDFVRQPLLPRKLSQLGPGVAWFDINDDGWDDLVIGSGRGGHLDVFINNQKGKFTPLLEAPYLTPVTRDQMGVLGLSTASGQRLLLAGSSNYEDGLAAGASVRQYDAGGKRIDDRLPGQLSSSGPLALADLDGDGDLDLFIGGRFLPGRYPEPASSLVLRQSNGRFEIDRENSSVLAQVGLVSGALWSDLDGDGFPELVLACDWGPIRVFKNQGGTLRDVTKPLGLDQDTGWWNGLAAVDLDGDGQLDLVAGNWGLNSDYSASRPHPLRMFYGDLSGRGSVDLLEAEYDPAAQDDAPRRRLDALLPGLPFLAEHFPTFLQFSTGTVHQLFSSTAAQPHRVEVNTLASKVFFNRGAHFEAVDLPMEAQWAPVFAVQAADFDGDGHEDLFLSQNFFATEEDLPRQDAGRGLLLLGNGQGKLRAISGQGSGIKIYGEQRGAAVSDYDQDGRPDLVVTQNSASTRLFRNVTAQPGLRVRLLGPPGNPNGIGAALRLRFPGHEGPVREIQAGSGYGSQDSQVPVLAAPEPPEAVWIRWPGGKVTITRLPRGVREIAIRSSGEAEAGTSSPRERESGR